MSSKVRPEVMQRLEQAYETMLERVEAASAEFEKTAAPVLQEAIRHAREKAVELGELTSEEAERLGGYLQRDLHEAAGHLADTGRELKDWLRSDLEHVEGELLNLFARVADRASSGLQDVAEQARQGMVYHTGEITGPGSLVCTACGETLHFRRAGHIPPCPRCHATAFRRTLLSEDVAEGMDRGDVDGD